MRFPDLEGEKLVDLVKTIEDFTEGEGEDLQSNFASSQLAFIK